MTTMGGWIVLALAEFLRRRRDVLSPADVGLSPGARRRTAGLRREEVAQLTGMSVDYYSRRKQARSTQPSPQMVRALARALRLTDDETDHLYRLAGHAVPDRAWRCLHVRPALLFLLRPVCTTSAAFVCSDTEIVLAQERDGQAADGRLDQRRDGTSGQHVLALVHGPRAPVTRSRQKNTTATAAAGSLICGRHGGSPTR